MKVKSGVNSLDKIIAGGIPKGDIVLVIGAPGAGKSIFGLHYVYQAVKNGKKAIYLTFELNKKILLKQAEGFKMDLNKYIDNNLLILREYDMTKTDVVEIYKDIKQLVETENPERIVIDSLSILSMYSEITAGMEIVRTLDMSPTNLHVSPEVLRRGAIVGLINMFRRTNVTALLIAEMPEGHHYLTRDTFSEFLCDDVIKLSRIESTGKRFVTIIKMRTSKHDLVPHKMDITNKGIVIK